jgi:hypothetical protein
MSRKSHINNRVNDIVLELVSGKKRVKIVSKYVKKWQCSDRTIDRLIKLADPIAKLKLELIEKEKEQEYVKIARESTKNSLLTKIELEAKLNDKIRRLDEIVSGAIFKDIDDRGNVVGFRQATFSDEIRSIQTQIQIGKDLSELNGWKAPSKIDINTQPVIINKNYKK